MISHTKKFLFLHLPKTGGTSINSTLSAYMNSNSKKHSNIQEMKSELGDKFDDYFKFTIIRNPWDRILSLYFCGVQIRPGRGVQANWKDKSFDEWIKTTFINDKLFNIWPNQIDLMKLDGNNVMDFVGRFENLQEDWENVSKRIGVDEELEYLYSTKHKHYSEYYNAESIEIVQQYYAKYIKTFDYEFEKG